MCPQVSYLWEHWTQTTSVVGFCQIHRNHQFLKFAGDNDRFFDQLFRCAQTVLHNGPSLARYTFQTASCFLNIDHCGFQANFSRICSHIDLATRTPSQYDLLLTSFQCSRWAGIQERSWFLIFFIAVLTFSSQGFLVFLTLVFKKKTLKRWTRFPTWKALS